MELNNENIILSCINIRKVLISISRILQLLHARTLTIPELESAAADRIYTYNPELRAMITINDESRMNSYDLNHVINEDQSDISSKGVLGVPAVLKDVFLTDDQSTSAGSMKYYGYRSNYSAPVVDLIEEHGALVMGKASTPEMAADVQTYNDIVGICRNPWNPDLTPGGSSGGVAVAVAMGFGHFGLGSDLAGSLRIPASFTGTVSLRPTEGRVSTLGHFPPVYAERSLEDEMKQLGILRPMDVLFSSDYGKSFDEIEVANHPSFFDCLAVGPMTRSVEDIEIVSKILFTPRTEFGSNLPKPKEENPQVGYKIAISPSFPYIPTDTKLIESIRNFGCKLENWKIETVDLNFPKEKYDLMKESYSWFGNRYISLSEANLRVHNTELKKRRQDRERHIMEFEELMEPFDFWILPASPTLPYPHNLDHKPILIDGHPVKYWKATISYTAFLSYLGFPVLTLPVDIVNGLPIGIQIVGKRWKDERLLAFGKLIEKNLGKFPHPPLFEKIPEFQEDEFLEEFDPALFDL